MPGSHQPWGTRRFGANVHGDKDHNERDACAMTTCVYFRLPQHNTLIEAILQFILSGLDIYFASSSLTYNNIRITRIYRCLTERNVVAVETGRPHRQPTAPLHHQNLSSRKLTSTPGLRRSRLAPASRKRSTPGRWA